MKRLLTFLAAAALLAAPTFARDEKTAIEEFKKDVASLKAWADEKEKSFEGDPLAPLRAIGEMVEKFKAVNTEGLPADLKEPWVAAAAVFGKVATMAAQIPKDQAEAAKKLEDPAFQKEFMGQMMDLQKEMLPTVEKLKAAAKKYGIEGLDKIGG